MKRNRMIRREWLALSVVAVLSASVALAQRGGSPAQVEWLHWGGDPGGRSTRRSTDINPENLSRLEIAWQWKHWETPLDEYGRSGIFREHAADDRRRAVRHHAVNSIAALDAETGKELWRFDGEAYKLGQILSGSGWKHRGPAFWRDGESASYFLNSRHRLFILDARTGKPVPSFAANGFLRSRRAQHVAKFAADRLQGPRHSRQPDSGSADRPEDRRRAGVRSPTASSGGRSHRSAVGRRPAAATWENESWRNSSHANVWAPMALDEARGLLYVPTHAEQRLLRRPRRAPICSPNRWSASKPRPAR